MTPKQVSGKLHAIIYVVQMFTAPSKSAKVSSGLRAQAKPFASALSFSVLRKKRNS